MSTAGGSAQDRYNTLSARFRTGRTPRMVKNIALATVVTIGAVALFADRYDSLLPWAIGVIYVVRS